MGRPRDITGMPVRNRMCSTCPFGPKGDKRIMNTVTARLFNVSQTCHSSRPKLTGKDTLICRGARDWQQTMFYRLGMLDAPTDEAWDEVTKKIKNPTSNTGQ